MILVTGATGNLGATAIGFLRGKMPSTRIAALARDLTRAGKLRDEGIDVKHGDYNDYQSLVSAFAGVDKLLFVSSDALEGVAEQHANVVRAAAEAGVRHVVFTSVANAPAVSSVRLVQDYSKTEDLLKASGLTYTILRNGYYLDMLPMLWGDAPNSGRVRYPAGDGRVSWAARIDLAEAAANILTAYGHEGRIYELNTNTSYSFHDVAAALSEVIGRPVEYVDIAPETMRQELRDQQMPPADVELMVELALSIRNSEADCPSPDLERLLGRAPMGLREFLRQTYGRQAA